MTPREERGNENKPAGGTQNQRTPGSRDKDKRQDENRPGGEARRGQSGQEGSQPTRTGTGGGQRESERRDNP